MRLRVSVASANDSLITLINKGYDVLHHIQEDHAKKKAAGIFNDVSDNQPYEKEFDEWAEEAVVLLSSTFPTALEKNTFLHPEVPFGAVSGDYRFGSLTRRLKYFVIGLNRIRQESLPQYTDLPISQRLYVEDIDSFMKVRDVNRGAVADLLQNGYMNWPEDSVQMALETILDVSMHKKDWGGETNDLYTANVVVNGQRVETAFLLKGNGLRRRVMEIKNCGTNGDQLVRLVQSPARLFVVQFVGNISEAVIKDIDGKVAAIRTQGQEAFYCIIDGQDTARLLRAYGKA